MSRFDNFTDAELLVILGAFNHLDVCEPRECSCVPECYLLKDGEFRNHEDCVIFSGLRQEILKARPHIYAQARRYSKVLWGSTGSLSFIDDEGKAVITYSEETALAMGYKRPV